MAAGCQAGQGPVSFAEGLQRAEEGAHQLSPPGSRILQAIFSVVRRLAPKSRTLRIQLRDKEGRLLAGAEESDQIASFLHTVFHSKHLVEAPKVDPFSRGSI